MTRVTYVSVRLDEEESKMMDMCLRKYSRFQGNKQRVLAEALRIYYQSQEATRWRQTRPPTE